MCIAEIAVLTGTAGRTGSFEEGGELIVFRREEGMWHRDRMHRFSPGDATTLQRLRGAVSELVRFLGSCRTIVAKSVNGVIFFELEKARCSVFEIDGVPDEFLDLVWRDISPEMETGVQHSGAGIPAPLETGPGIFTISIRDIQGKNPEISSKQILRNFIHRGEFSELRILCDHPPPWIEMEAVGLGIHVETETQAPGSVRMVLTKMPDSGCC